MFYVLAGLPDKNYHRNIAMQRNHKTRNLHIMSKAGGLLVSFPATRH